MRLLLRSILALALVACASIGGVAYAAKKFDPTNEKIVVHESIADVKLGQSVSAAKRAWKGNVRCHPQGDAAGCLWGSASNGGHLGFIYARGRDRVFQITVVATAKRGKNVFSKPLTTVKTSKGIGIGSRFSAAKRAYPGGSRDGYQYSIKRGKVTTTFGITADGRISDIVIENVSVW